MKKTEKQTKWLHAVLYKYAWVIHSERETINLLVRFASAHTEQSCSFKASSLEQVWPRCENNISSFVSNSLSWSVSFAVIFHASSMLWWVIQLKDTLKSFESWLMSGYHPAQYFCLLDCVYLYLFPLASKELQFAAHQSIVKLLLSIFKQLM